MATITLIMVLYRLFTFFIALSIIWMGYRLFRLGIYEKAGELKTSWSGRSLTLRQAAPGTFFVLLGAIVLGIALHRSFGVTVDSKQVAPTGSQAAASTPSTGKIAQQDENGKPKKDSKTSVIEETHETASQSAN